MLHLPRLKYHIQTIGINQSLSNNTIYLKKKLENIKKLYKHAGKCDNQKQFKDIFETAMVSTPEGFIDDIPVSPMTSTSVNKPRAQKSLCLFKKNLDLNKSYPSSWSY